MSDDLTVIYRARTAAEAHLLRNLLAEREIQAVVVNDVLESGSGVDVLGWATLARVLVHQRDAEQARTLALEFDRQAAASRLGLAGQAGDQPAGEEDDTWPLCPQCQAPRPTHCPACHRFGRYFPLADPPPAAEAEADEPVSPVPRLRLCPQCDEAFEPSFPSRCEWCGHRFEGPAAGGDAASRETPLEPMNRRILLAGSAVVLVVLAVLGWFAWVLYQ